MTIPTIYDLRTERGPLCEYCKERQAEQRHHCLVPDRKRFHEEVTVKENLMAVCAYCHTGICVLDRREVRIWFYDVQCNRYGVDHMEDWLKSLPAKLWISGRIDFIGNENNLLAKGCFHKLCGTSGLTGREPQEQTPQLKHNTSLQVSQSSMPAAGWCSEGGVPGIGTLSRPTP